MPKSAKSARPTPHPPPLTHARRLELLGEIDAITLKNLQLGSPACVGVFITIAGVEVELLRDVAVNSKPLTHEIRRAEIAKTLCCAGVK